MDLIGLGLWCFAIAAAGGLAGLVLGNLRLPLVLVLASSPAAGGGTNLAISGLAAATASAAHIRAGRVNWQLFAWMAPPSGGYLAGVAPQRALLLSVAAVLLGSGVDLLRRPPQARAAGDGGEPRLDVRAAVVSGAAIGLLGGFVGLLLGSLRMPVLLKLVGETPVRAVGTNVTVGVCVGIAGLLGHLPSAPPDWDLLAVGAAASIPGALVGSRLTGRLSQAQLVRALAAVLLVAAVSLAVQALV